MLNRFKQNFAALATAGVFMLGSASAVQAQTVIWGAGSGIAEDIAQFNNPTTPADTTIAGTGWTPTAISSPIYGMWERSLTGLSRGANALSRINGGDGMTLTSPSLANGVAMFDSDNYYEAAPASAPQSGYITSPAIDLTGWQDSALVISMHTAYLEWELDSIHVGFSIDGGTTWRYVDIRSITGTSGRVSTYSGIVNVPITQDLAGATNLTDCRVRFSHKGDSYYWTIDDVSIRQPSAYDLAISGPTSGSTLGDAFTVVYVSNNRYVPLSQVDTSEYAMGARILNNGANNITAAANARLILHIERSTGANMWVTETMDTIAVDSVNAGDRATYTGGLASGWIPTQVGDYRATYFVQHDLADATASNDSSMHMFTVTENDGYMSKVPLALDGGVAVTGASFPAASGASNLVSGFEFGNMYYFPRGAAYQVDSVNFRAYIQDAGAAFTGGGVTARIARFADGDNDGVITDASEVILVGLGTVNFTDVADGYKRGSAVITNTDGFTLNLSDTTFYYVSLSQDRVGGLENAAGEFFGYWYGTNAINYGINAALFTAAPTPIRVTETPAGGGSTTTDWNWIGFGPDVVPAIGINISPFTIAVDEVEVNAHGMNLFPNPASTELNVQIDLAQAADVTYIMTDVTGRVVRLVNNKNVQTEAVTFQISDLAAGVYFVTVKTGKTATTQRFVKQ